MKLFCKIFVVLFVLSFTACQDFANLDLQQDPNAVSPDQADLGAVYNSVMINFKQVNEDIWPATASVTRMVHEFPSYQYNYLSCTTPISFNEIWQDSYSGLFADIETLIALAEPIGLDIHVASAKVLKAYTMMALVDMFGDIPYSNALRADEGSDFFSPTADSGADVYAAAGALLDEAIASLTGTTASAPANDLMYGGSASSWLKAATSLKLRAAVTTRLVNSGAAGEINSLIASGNLISSASEDFQFNYGSQRLNPNSRHRFYTEHYEADDGDYMSNYYMWLLRAEKVTADGIEVIDPRIRFYFYRQVDDSDDQDPNSYACHFSTLPTQADKPAYYGDIPYCYASLDGYIGRDHLNGEGIPPDGPTRTMFGLYPGGGQFDDDSFQFTQQLGSTGGLGQGIWPLLLSSHVDFLLAESALTLGTTGDARALLESGVRKSIDKVISFKSLVPTTMGREIEIRGGGSATVEELYVASSDKIDEYVDFVLARYDAAADDDSRLDVVMKEYFIALWGNGLDAYNMYRRTGKPDNMAPALESNPGPFIRSFFYPAQYVNLNANASQKENTKQVFWDTNPADFVY